MKTNPNQKSEEGQENKCQKCKGKLSRRLFLWSPEYVSYFCLGTMS